MIKGYIIQQTGRFIANDPTLSKRVPGSVLSSINASEALKPTGFYPRQEAVLLWRAIADTQPNEEAAYAELVRCGETVGAFAAGTFLKLLLKMLTPHMFANKFPDLYKRDHQ